MRQYFTISNLQNNNLNVDLTLFKKFIIYDWSIPYSFYNVYSYNNIFLIGGNTITIPQKNYDINTLKTQVESQVAGLTITFDTSTYKTTLTQVGVFDLVYSPFLELLGFETTQTLTGLNTYTSNNIFNINKHVNNVFLKSINLYNVLNYKPLSRNNLTDGFITNINSGNFSFGNIITNFNSQNIILPLHNNSNYIPAVNCELSDYYGNNISNNGQEILLFCYIE